MRQSTSTANPTRRDGKAAGFKMALFAALTAADLVLMISRAYSAEPQGGCAEEGGYFLTSTSQSAHFQSIDLELGNGDGFVCVKALPHGAGQSGFTISIIDNRVQRG